MGLILDQLKELKWTRQDLGIASAALLGFTFIYPIVTQIILTILAIYGLLDFLKIEKVKDNEK